VFYCGACAKENGWPTTGTLSLGPCEVCGTKALCNERPSALLPVKKPPKK
jgi:DNA-directed RNA polymerase subunit RPC12/RpoP